MSRILRWTLVVCCVSVAIALGVAAWYRLSRPTVLKVAVGPADFDDAALISAFARKFVAGGSPVRLSIVPSSGPADAFERLKKGEAQLAVVRSDGNGSEQAQAVALLHTDPVVIVAPEKTGVESFGDLKGKTIGVVGPPGANDSLLRTLRQHYRAPGETRTLAPAPLEVSTAIRTRAVDALLFVVPTTRGVKLGESWASVRSASRRKLAFVSLDEAEALAAANPAYESGEIEAGQFGGSPSLPEESVTTITVATYLVANRNVSADAITALTRTLFQERQAVSGEAPIANLIKAASTEKDAVYPLHPGAKVYYGGEETSLMERYGDWLFYGTDASRRPRLGASGRAAVPRIPRGPGSDGSARADTRGDLLDQGGTDACRARCHPRRRRRRRRAARREGCARRIRRAANGRALSRHQLHRSPYRREARCSAERPGRELFRCSPGAACSALMRPPA